MPAFAFVADAVVESFRLGLAETAPTLEHVRTRKGSDCGRRGLGRSAVWQDMVDGKDRVSIALAEGGVVDHDGRSVCDSLDLSVRSHVVVA